MTRPERSGRWPSSIRRPREGPRRRGRIGFWGPVPYYSTRTRRGTEVSVGGCGCCLPIPLLALAATVVALRAARRRWR
ncbi:MAG TPA: hypothetical protein VKZ81_33785 [Pseudonocardia sp.]|jgi:hypothetical protein|uniref:hypothetical protein n=1 Tax=Pseudonocardia sp. TaxID=60912 RepID=UPI002B4ACD40|nr:hypothetical protein [Pseudonocardia sp.]HLU60458.1 hypothetical protein [Pseudonocardia sp.]